MNPGETLDISALDTEEDLAELLAFLGKNVDDEETPDTAYGGCDEDGAEDRPDVSTSGGDSTTDRDSTIGGDSTTMEDGISDSVSKNLITPLLY